MHQRTLLLLPGDGIGPEIFEAMTPLFDWLGRHQPGLTIDRRLAGHAAFVAEGAPVSDETLACAAASAAVLFGSEDTEGYTSLSPAARPAPALLRLRTAVGGYANLRPVRLHPSLEALSSLKPDVIRGVDMLIVRELLGGLYFGEPRSIETLSPDGRRRAVDSLVYHSDEIKRVVVVGFEQARMRRSRLCSVDKANVLATSRLWREVVNIVAAAYPDVALSHMYVDNCAMQLVRDPRQFDVIVTENMFGDILSDCAAMLGGSIGMLPSASIGASDGGRSKGLYEAISGSAPDIAGRDVANPVGTVLSLALALRHSLGSDEAAAAVERAVDGALADGARTRDLGGDLGTRAMIGAIAAGLPG